MKTTLDPKKTEISLINDLKKLSRFSTRLKLTNSSIELIDELVKRIEEKFFCWHCWSVQSW